MANPSRQGDSLDTAPLDRLKALLIALSDALNAMEREQSGGALAAWRELAADAVAPAVGSLKPDPGLPALMTVPDAAKLLGISRASAYRYADAGLLPARRFGRRVYVVRDQLTAQLASSSLLADARTGAA